MKKLLFTLLVGLMVISCDKQEETISPLALEQEISAKDAIDLDSYFNYINDLASGYESNGKSSPSSRKTGADGTEWLHTVWFSANSIPLVVISSDDAPEICENGETSVLYTYEVASNGAARLKIEVGDQAATYTIVTALKSGYDTLFSDTIDKRIRRANASGTGTVAGNIPSLSTLESNFGLDLSCTVAAAWGKHSYFQDNVWVKDGVSNAVGYNASCNYTVLEGFGTAGTASDTFTAIGSSHSTLADAQTAAETQD